MNTTILPQTNTNFCMGCSRIIREGEPTIHAAGCTTAEGIEQRKSLQHPDVFDPARVGSTSDDRVINNVVRHEYRVLSDREKEAMKALKDLGREFLELLEEIKKDSHIPQTLESGRAYALAKTNAQQAVMWAVYGLTG